MGTELLLGQIADTNAQWMSEQLAAIGVDVTHHQAVGDNQERIVEALRIAASRADVVLVCGGLGPTEDDITRDAIAELAGVPLVHHDELEQMLREKFRRWSSIGTMPESNLRQATVPEGAATITPDRGTAPGLIVQLDGTRLYAVPGVPDEMREMVAGIVVPELSRLAGGEVIVSQVLRVAGMGESAVAERLADLFTASSNPSIAYLASMGEVKVRLTAKAASDEEARALVRPLADEIRRRLGDVIFTDTDESLEAAVIRLLTAAGKRLACAESLTGGGVGERLTSVPGASAVFLGSAVVYTADMKRRVLGVSEEALAGGTVTEACALAMAEGAQRLFGADVALALTGAAGPEPHDGAAPGTIWVAIADAGGVTH
ncbi:MAG: competence/damage-inducible protein A, partial [Actinomycetota bacterium]|nr:competence/damage-inducible protein A [Actinomycetota bacterium]